MTGLLTVADAAVMVGRDVRTVRRWIAEGKLSTQWGKVWEPDLIAARDSARRRKRSGMADGRAPRVGKRIEASGDAGRDEVIRAIAQAVLDIDNRESVDLGTLTVRASRVGDAIEIDVGALAA